jgi:hypothetical protein
VVGGLVGQNSDVTGSEVGVVENSYSEANVDGSNRVGGLVGRLFGGTVEDSYAEGGVEGSSRTGGLIGIATSGTVTGSYATGSVSASSPGVDLSWGGGLVGQNSGTITESYATGSVDGSRNTGGLVGQNGGTIADSYATGSVDSSRVAGGLVGRNENIVSESYATGAVNGTIHIGGIVGFNTDGFEIEGTVSESYASGQVTGETAVGGLTGTEYARTTDSYWDVQLTGQPDGVGDDRGIFEGTGLTTSEMTGSAASSNMGELDFTSTWETVPGDYPILVWQAEDEPAPANFEVSIDSTNSPVTEGDTLTADVTIENTGDEPDTQTITAAISGIGSITETVNLNGGESRTETVPVKTTPGDAGTYTLTVESEDDTATETVTVESDRNGGSGGSLSSGNPFGDTNNEPLSVGDAADVLFQWNQNGGTVNGVDVSVPEMADFLFEWNRARN